MPKSLVEIAETEIRKLIIRGDLDLGQRITESELAKRFGMSKTPVHEALQHLQREGLVQVRPRQGTFIFTFTEELVTSLLGVRDALETFALREADRKNRGRLLQGMARNIEQGEKLREAGEVPPYFKVDNAFHAFLLKYADNPFLIAAYSAISVKNQVLWRHTLSSEKYTLDSMRVSLEEHRNIFEHIYNDDLDGACAILSVHMRRTRTDALTTWLL